MYKCNICVYNASLLQNSQYKADDMYYTFDAYKRNLNLLLPCDFPRISTKTKCTWRKSSGCRRRDGQSSEMRNNTAPKELKIYT